MLEEILQRVEANLNRYDSRLPSLFCDEHVVSKVEPDQGHHDTTTDSVFRVRRTAAPDHTSSLVESREVKSVNGKTATKQDQAPIELSGAFEGGLAVVSLSQKACMKYELERGNRKEPAGSYVVRFSTDLTRENSANCLLQENSKGVALVDPVSMQITHLEITTLRHVIHPGDIYTSRVVGRRVLAIDYAPVVLGGETFLLPSTIGLDVIQNFGSFHMTTWSLRATYRNYHKLEVTSRVVDAGSAPVQ